MSEAEIRRNVALWPYHFLGQIETISQILGSLYSGATAEERRLISKALESLDKLDDLKRNKLPHLK